MLHPYTALVWGMGASLACFYAAFFYRWRNNRLHRLLAVCGIALNLSSSVYLLYTVRLLGVAMPSHFSADVILAHRIFATVMAVLMLAMAGTGAKGRLALHRKLSRVFLPGYTLTYISGLVIFHA